MRGPRRIGASLSPLRDRLQPLRLRSFQRKGRKVSQRTQRIDEFNGGHWRFLLNQANPLA
jgi:hypothetical protein